MKTPSLAAVLLLPALVLLVPLIAMRFTDEVAWDETDFIVAWGLMAGAGLAYRLLARKAGDRTYLIGATIAVATAFGLTWINLAVGIIGSEDHPANRMYVGVVAVGIAGAALARLESGGMARALFATALAQALVPVMALVIWRPGFTPGVAKTLVLNAIFVALFASAGFLFRHAAARARGPHAA